MKTILLTMFAGLQRQLSPQCDEINAGILYDCDNPPSGGANDRLILFNLEDLQNATITYNVSNPLLIENIVLGSGVVGYVFEGLNSSVEPRTGLVKGRYVNGYDHEIRFKVFQNTPAIKATLNKLDGAKLVALVQNNHKGASGNSAFELYGLETGVLLQELARTTADAELQGAYDLLIRNNETSRPSSLPETIFITDFATTLALVNSLV
jgi:hypothetical protein